MKKTITNLALAFALTTGLSGYAQNIVSFDTFTLSPNSYYQSNAGNDFSNGPVTFRYDWAGYWSEGTSYTNVADTVDGSYTNIYGCIPGVAFSGTNYATMQDKAIMTFSNSSTALTGFYITNTTYAWKVIKNGNSFSRKFGDTTGTKSGGVYPQGGYPDWFKLVIKGYRSGTLLNDSVQFYLADYRAAGTANDYVVKNWQYVDCSSIKQADSIQFIMRSSDTGAFGINTPTYFSVDNIITDFAVSVNELEQFSSVSLYPNPTQGTIVLSYSTEQQIHLSATVYDVTGKQLLSSNTQHAAGSNQLELQTAQLEAGIYFMEVTDGKSSKKIKFIKL